MLLLDDFKTLARGWSARPSGGLWRRSEGPRLNRKELRDTVVANSVAEATAIAFSDVAIGPEPRPDGSRRCSEDSHQMVAQPTASFGPRERLEVPDIGQQPELLRLAGPLEQGDPVMGRNDLVGLALND